MKQCLLIVHLTNLAHFVLGRVVQVTYAGIVVVDLLTVDVNNNGDDYFPDVMMYIVMIFFANTNGSLSLLPKHFVLQLLLMMMIPSLLVAAR